DFGGVDVAGDEQDGFAFGSKGVDLLRRERAGIGELVGDGFVFIFVEEIFRGGDDGHDHLFAESGLAEDLDLNEIGIGGEGFEIGRNLAIVGEFAVGADFKLEELGGSGEFVWGGVEREWTRETGKQENGEEQAEALKLQHVHPLSVRRKRSAATKL